MRFLASLGMTRSSPKALVIPNPEGDEEPHIFAHDTMKPRGNKRIGFHQTMKPDLFLTRQFDYSGTTGDSDAKIQNFLNMQLVL